MYKVRVFCPPAVQAGDFYFFNNGAIDTTGQTLAGTLLTGTSGGGPITFIIPPPESFPGPTPAPFPTFTFGPIGNGIQESAVQAHINWEFSNTSNHITVTATGTSQNGRTSTSNLSKSTLPVQFENSGLHRTVILPGCPEHPCARERGSEETGK